LFFGAGAGLAAQLGAPDALIVALFGGLIIALAQVSRAGGRLGDHPVLVYLGEISYSIYMICIPWQLLFVNLSAKILHLGEERLPWYLWIIFLVSVIPLAALTHSLIERPARARMRLWRGSRVAHELAIVTTG
jgi:peptidoglycan/LPS O-acetylase OafA/YrhL